MAALLLGAAVLAILFYYYIVKPYSYWKERGIVQGRPVWVFGDIWKAVLRIQTPCDMVYDMYNRFPNARYSGVYQFFRPRLLIKDPELIKQVTTKEFDHFTDHVNFAPPDIDPFWGNNLLVLEGKKWRDMRSLLSPSFTSSKMKLMYVLIQEYVEKTIKYLQKKDQDIVKINAKDFFSRITNDIIATTSFGINVDSISQVNNEFYVMGKRLADVTIKFYLLLFGSEIFKNLFKFFKIQMFSKEVRTYFENTIFQSVKIREEENIERPDMINLMIQARKSSNKQANGTPNGFTSEKAVSKKLVGEISNQEIAAQAMVFFFGGFDSVSSLMSFTAYELAMHQDIQSRLRKEVLETLKECGGPTYDGLSKMKYMEMVISESLRKWPNFVFIDRQCTKDFVIEPKTPDEKPVHIKEGSALIIPIYGIHRDPKYYPDPERFDPERFNDENKDKIDPYAYLPFGLGPRKCIGAKFATMETKAVLFYLLQNFEIIPVEETDIPVKVSKKTVNTQPARLTLGLKRIK